MGLPILPIAMSDLVTVYVPTHNRRPLVERATASVLAQTHANLELIVVNDGSSDDTGAFLDDLAERDPRVTALHTEIPGGAPAARNRAVKLAKGTFITGLDDDDEFHPRRIEEFLSHWHALGAEQESISCLFSECVMTDGDTSVETRDRGDNIVYADLFRHNYIGNQVFCPTERFHAIDGFDEQLPAWQDLETFMRLVDRFGPARLVPLATYICHVERGRDRISAKPEKLRTAFEKIVVKHGSVPEKLKQQLFLQMFSPFYGMHPTFQDWRRMIFWGAQPAYLAKMLRANIRNRLR